MINYSLFICHERGIPKPQLIKHIIESNNGIITCNFEGDNNAHGEKGIYVQFASKPGDRDIIGRELSKPFNVSHLTIEEEGEHIPNDKRMCNLCLSFHSDGTYGNCGR
jgi:hypothetical protein